MNYKIYFLIVTYVCLIAELVSIPFRTKKNLSSCGELKFELKNKSKISVIGIYVFCFLIPLVLLFKDFSVLYSVMFCAVAVLGSEVATRDASLCTHYGVYENCVIAGGSCVFYDDIVVFPILELPEEEQADFDKANLVISTKSKGNVDMPFANEAECKAATKVIRELSGK